MKLLLTRHCRKGGHQGQDPNRLPVAHYRERILIFRTSNDRTFILLTFRIFLSFPRTNDFKLAVDYTVNSLLKRRENTENMALVKVISKKAESVPYETIAKMLQSNEKSLPCGVTVPQK